jgi:hypothetical protein
MMTDVKLFSFELQKDDYLTRKLGSKELFKQHVEFLLGKHAMKRLFASLTRLRRNCVVLVSKLNLKRENPIFV